MDGFGFRWMKFFGLRLNCKKKYDDEARPKDLDWKQAGGRAGGGERGRALGKFFLSLVILIMARRGEGRGHGNGVFHDFVSRLPRDFFCFYIGSIKLNIKRASGH